MTIDLSMVGLLTAFAAGLISFLSPCVLPLVPGYLSYVGGVSLEELRDDARSRLRATGYAVWFVLGFGTVFVLLGASASWLGDLLLGWRYELGIAAGIVVILFGLHMMGLSPLNLLQREARFHVDLPGGRTVGAYLMGIAFAFGWTPCIGPVLGAILTLSASSADLGRGVALLATYSLGLGVPFLLAAMFTGRLLGLLRTLGRVGRRLQQISGALLIIMGLLMMTGQIERLSFWLLEHFPILARLG